MEPGGLAEGSDAELVEPILAAVAAVKKSYAPFGPATDTLATKVILGTLGCLPACDRFFIDGFKQSGHPYSYRGLEELAYPLHDWTATITRCGRICWNRRKINVSVVFAGQNVGVRQVSDRIWLVSFMDYDLGYFDDETCRLEPIANPFAAKVLPMAPE